MIFPPGEILHSNLFTSYLNINELISNLTGDKFTGYIEVKFWDYRGFIFFDSGNPINALEEIGGDNVTGWKTGKQAHSSIINKSRDKDGEVSVHLIEDDKLITLASVVNRKVLHEDLTTDYVKLEKLIEKLVQEEPSGYIDIKINKNKGKGVIFFGEGDIQDSILEEGKAQPMHGEEALVKILDLCETNGAVFNVYKTDMMATSATIVTEPIAGAFFDGLIQELTTLMGPMAGMIIDEVVEGFGESRNTFPKTRADELIDKVAKEIGDAGQQKQFVTKVSKIPR